MTAEPLLPATDVTFDEVGLLAATRSVRKHSRVVRDRRTRSIGLATGVAPLPPEVELLGTLPPTYPEWLGDRDFLTEHGARFPYVAGEMANGIAGTRMVVAMAEAGMLGIFGAGGLAPAEIECALAELTKSLRGRRNWGVNLIHMPGAPELEDRVADLLIAAGTPIVSASAFMELTPAVVRCSAAGLTVDRQGRIVRRTKLIAKVSRPEIAEQFMAPAPPQILEHLVTRRLLSATEALLARKIPVAQDVTAEADSGGHTDNRPLSVLLPSLLASRDTMSSRLRVPAVRVGAAGGIGTPAAVAGAFATGAAYVVTGTINQTAVEAELSGAAKELLAQADLMDVCMAPASDMFELGIKLQVLRRGTMFAGRAAQLYELYQSFDSFESIPAQRRQVLERTVLGESFQSAWTATRAYWLHRDPGQVARAERDPRHLMALVFRSYLGRSSQWAIDGTPARRTDFQIWCGPVIGAFNRWIGDSFLSHAENRTVAQIGLNLMEGAAVVTRAQQLRSSGVPVPSAAFSFVPRPLA
ncbi:PfaD family polyunsaturated fatty acid/polyketide biosynthesis protein [Amycolatopsis sp. cg5]|uniref:PfaD family polyunsaturated fatty acid/polyketide biosynthesis protein n=1 Tax=Amycolatopsis sp. cg5 TaxID=3238802 RepID=UPI003525D991